MVGVPGFFCQMLTRFLARLLTRFFDQVFWTRKYNVQYYWDGKIQFYSTTGTEKSLGKNHVIKNPISLKIPYIKNLAVKFFFPQVWGRFGGFRELRQACRIHFHISWYLFDKMMPSYGPKPRGGLFLPFTVPYVYIHVCTLYTHVYVCIYIYHILYIIRYI